MPQTGELAFGPARQALGRCDDEPDFGMKGPWDLGWIAEHPRPGLSSDSLPKSHFPQL